MSEEPNPQQQRTVTVLLCGPFPPPVGGISTHIARLSDLLLKIGYSTLWCDDAAERKPAIFNIRSMNVFLYLKLVMKSDVFHIHSSIDAIRLFHLFIAFTFRKRAIVTIHSWRKSGISTKLWSFALTAMADRVIAVNSSLFDRIALPHRMQLVRPAFIPPTGVPSPLPDGIREFIAASRANDKVIACTNAFRLVTNEGVDLYGIDLCLHLFRNSDISSRCSLVCVISDPSVNKDLIDSYQEFILEHKLCRSIYLQLGPIDFCSLLISSDFSIRATNTDGDALSIRESIHFQKPCIASDCVDRPEATILFENRSIASLHSVVSSLLRARNVSHHAQSIDDSAEFYFDLFGYKQ